MMGRVDVTSWQNQKKWATGKIKSSNLGGMIFIAIFAAFWNAIAWTAFIASFDEMRTKGGPAYMVLLFPLIGLVLIAGLVYQLMRQFRFGTSVFEMKPQPGVLGGKVGGVIHIPKHIEPEAGFELTLSCIHRYTSGSGKNRSTKEMVKWQDRKIIQRELLANDLTRTAIPVLFGVPYDYPATDVIGGDGYCWRLEVKAVLPGVDYSARFEIPVFRTEASDPEFNPETVVVSGYEKTVTPEERLASSRLQIEAMQSGGLRIVCPMFRGIGTGLMLMLMGGIFSGVMFAPAPLMFRAIFGLVGLGIFCGGLDMLFWKSDLEASSSGLYVRNGLFGLKGLRINTSEMEAIDSATGCTTNNRVWYVVKLKTTEGKKVTLAKGLPDERTANDLANWLKKELRM
jgi:hypothetical protein